ncbi:hypothetical protein CMV_028551 [Castanea mollissima]|uniref:NB-ARC domain-containing protein n=1 Tax=Castanea mollissima TaxID=60419 RepID=A0A8J4VBY7_9ROSI|nr:hypothetical protein CMV_028551 [Castanea mollissima]
MSMNEVQASLQSILEKNRFFIVLDDVWNEDRNKWIAMKNLLIGGGQGSKILVTTRNQKVASMMASGPFHHIKGLSNDVCLSLLLRWAFNRGEEKQYPKLVEIGQQIVKKCKGVPLAIRTLGSLLYSKTEESDWISVRDSEIWKLEQQEEDILPALRLSYDRLPSYLKQYFAYCVLYPKDFRYNSSYLIQSWMANGLLQKSNKSNQELEDIGLQYIKELLSRSFFQEVQDHGCPRLLRFPEGIQRLTALHRLEFTYCENLTSLPRGMKHLTALEVLGIWDCEKLILMEGDDYPMRLRRLTIGFLPKLVSLPQGLIPSANTLQFLAIYHCGNLEKLPQRLPNLSSLPKLDIMNCPKLLSLPKRMDRRLVLKD